MREEEKVGIVTALHAVIDCDPNDIVVTSPAWLVGPDYKRVTLEKVDIDRDAAFLTGQGLGNKALDRSHGVPDGWLYVIGHPNAFADQTGIYLNSVHPLFLSLGRRSVEKFSEVLVSRGSPSLDTPVLFFDGELQPGHSGAPIMNDDGFVVAFADGGYKSGNSDLVWAMPLKEVSFEANRGQADYLKGMPGKALMAFSEERPKPAIPPLYLNDMYDPDGVIYRRLSNGDASIMYGGTGSAIGSIASHASSGRIAFPQGREIFEISKDKVRNVFAGAETVYGVGYDSVGRLYYSTVDHHDTRTGAIWRLSGGRPKLHLTVDLQDMHGHWMGDFAFSPDDSLWLSNGNLTTAYLYEVVDGVPKPRYTGAQSPIGGFTFIDKDNLFFSDLEQSVRRLNLKTMTEDQPIRFGTVRRLSDVAVIPGKSSTSGAVTVGYLVVIANSGISRLEDVNAATKLCGFGDDLERLTRMHDALGDAKTIRIRPAEIYQVLQTAVCSGFLVDDIAKLNALLGPEMDAFKRIPVYSP